MDVDGGSTSSQDNVVGEEPEVSSVFRPITHQTHPFLRGREETSEDYVPRLIDTMLSFVPPQETRATPGTQLSATASPVLLVPSQETFCLPPSLPLNPAMSPTFATQGTITPAAAPPSSSLQLAYRKMTPPLNPNSVSSMKSSTDSSQMPPLSVTPQEISSEPPPINYPIIVPYSNSFAGSRNPPPWYFIPTPPSRPPPSPVDPPYSSPPVDNRPMAMIPEMLPPPNHQDQDQDQDFRLGGGQATQRKVKSEIIERPYPWATTRRARIQAIQYMELNQINFIGGWLRCRHCFKVYEMEYNLRSKFIEVYTFIAMKKGTMNGEAPNVWMNPVLPSCCFCGAPNSAEPVVGKKRSINWLFLFLGQMLGYLELPQLRYFCKHTGNPQQLAGKPLVLYHTYMGLCKQLFPCGPFEP